MSPLILFILFAFGQATFMQKYFLDFNFLESIFGEVTL